MYERIFLHTKLDFICRREKKRYSLSPFRVAGWKSRDCLDSTPSSEFKSNFDWDKYCVRENNHIK